MTCRRRQRLVMTSLLVILAGVAGFGRAAEAGGIAWKAVALDGMSVPGVSDGSVFQHLVLASMGEERLVFYGRAGEYPIDHQAIFSWEPGVGIEVVASLDATSISANGSALLLDVGYQNVAGSEAIVIDRRVNLAACPSNLILQEASLIPNGVGGLTPIVAPGMPVPGIEPGWIFAEGAGAYNFFGFLSQSPPQINEHGDLAFFAKIRRSGVCDADPAAPYAIALFGPDGEGGFTLAAMPQDPAPGAPAGAVLSDMGGVVINEVGEIAMLTAVRLGPSGPTVDAIYRWDVTNGLRLVALANDPNPDGLHREVSGLLLSDGGHIIFSTDRELFLQDESSGLIQVVRNGDTVPGRSGDLELLSHGSFAVNALGDVAFSGSVSIPGSEQFSRRGVWVRYASGALALRLLAGQPAPHLYGLTIDEAVVLAINDQRELLIQVWLKGPGIDDNAIHPANKTAFYRVNSTGNFELLVRDGDTLEFAPGEFRAIHVEQIFFNAGIDRFAFENYNAGVNAIFYAAVPEPGSCALAFVAFSTTVALTRMRRAC